MNATEINQYAPYIIMAFVFFMQNKIFVRPEELAQIQLAILNAVDTKLKGYVELNAYKEFQNHVLNELADVNKGINEVKEILINRG